MFIKPGAAELFLQIFYVIAVLVRSNLRVEQRLNF